MAIKSRDKTGPMDLFLEEERARDAYTGLKIAVALLYQRREKHPLSIRWVQPVEEQMRLARMRMDAAYEVRELTRPAFCCYP